MTGKCDELTYTPGDCARTLIRICASSSVYVHVHPLVSSIYPTSIRSSGIHMPTQILYIYIYLRTCALCASESQIPMCRHRSASGLLLLFNPAQYVSTFKTGCIKKSDVFAQFWRFSHVLRRQVMSTISNVHELTAANSFGVTRKQLACPVLKGAAVLKDRVLSASVLHLLCSATPSVYFLPLHSGSGWALDHDPGQREGWKYLVLRPLGSPRTAQADTLCS